MKIGVLIDELIYGGFQKVAIEEVYALRKMGHDADLLVLHKKDEEGFPDLLEQYGIFPIYLDDKLPRFLKINFKFPLFAFFSFFHVRYPLILPFFFSLREYKYIIAHGTYTAFSSIGYKKQVPYIAFIHDSIDYIIKQRYNNKSIGKLYSWFGFLGRFLDKTIVKNATKVVAFPYMIQHLKKYASKQYQYYQKVRNGCVPIGRKSIVQNKHDFYLALTRWDKNKNLTFLINLREEGNFGEKLKIVGKFSDPSYLIDIKKHIKIKGLSDTVEIVGPVSEDQLSFYYKNAKCLVHPCREAFGMTILESSAHGCPSVFTRNSGVFELYPSLIQKIQPQENDISGYLAAINEVGEIPLTEFYHIAKQNTRQQHCLDILKNLK